ncbi:MAG TPA: TylF/MycF/NovP-related O-methyltransferase [Pyrinomonadaceae bacterium]|jgi:hypothetical protein
MKKVVKRVLRSVYGLLQRPSLRYSGAFYAAQGAINFFPYEYLTKTVMEFVAYSNLEGDYLEFGVFEGAHFTAAFHFARMNGLGGMRFYAFDSFEGLPEVSGVDLEAPRQFSRGQYSCDEGKFRRIVERNGVDMGKVTLIPGWFQDTLTPATRRELPLEKAAVIWIDCDFYESTVPVLKFIGDYVQDGTVLIFDDWFCFNGNPNYGQQRAFREWLECNPSITAREFHKYGWAGLSFILNRDARPAAGAGDTRAR